MGVSPARRAAFSALRRVENDQAFATDLLQASSILDGLEERDRALASELVLGCLRWQGELDHLLETAAGRPLARLDPEVRLALRIGAYQLRHLERIPARAAVDESVELVKRARKRSAAGFVNAVLRKLPQRPPAAQSCELAHPTWLVERWRRTYGDGLAASILQANLQQPATYLRVNPRYALEETLQLLSQEGVETEETGDPLCRLVRRGRPASTRCYREKRIRIQDIGSQKIVPLLDLQPQHRFLDLCAAPGGKTFQVVEAKGTAAGVIAADRHLHRLRILRNLAPEPLPLLAADARDPLPLRGRFDRILVDAPCSGTGTLARNPEIKWRLRPSDLDSLAEKQRKILQNALAALSPGGILVYATCSLEPEENREAVDAALAAATGFETRAYLLRIPGRDPGEGFFACQIAAT